MRLWSVHPRYLDRQGLVAGWREGLLAQAVIERSSGGYSRHPQLDRFRASPDPALMLSLFLWGLLDEADTRGYRFAREKILGGREPAGRLPVTTGQVDYEWCQLIARMRRRSPDWASRWVSEERPDVHPIFVVVEGPIESWERVALDPSAWRSHPNTPGTEPR